METSLSTLINLLHRCQAAAIATHSTSLLEYPYASAVQFIADEHQRPILLMSRLAQHARDLAKDARASLVVHRVLPKGEMVRATYVGTMQPIDPEPLLVERYLRYHPHAGDFLGLGDSRFFRMQAAQIHVVGGFSQGDWMTPDRLATVPWLPLAFERDVIDSLERPDRVSVLGVDCFGVDLDAARGRQRFSFGQPIAAAGKARGVVQDLLDRLRQ